MVIYVVKTTFAPFSAIGENPANAGVARLCGVSPRPVPDTTTALPNQARYQLRYTRIFNFCHYTTTGGKIKDFSVCGQSCGQSRFCAVFGNRGKVPRTQVSQAFEAFRLTLSRIPPRHSQTVCGNFAYYTSFLRVLQEGETLRMGEFVGQQYILNKSITQDMACRQSNEVRGKIRREPCQPEI